MRIDFRRSVFLSAGLLVIGTLLTSDLPGAPAHALMGRSADVPESYGRSVDREGIAKRRVARQQRAARAATRQRLVPTAPRSPAAAARPADEAIWERLRNCEAGGRYDRDSGNGFYGAYQFSARTWRGLGYQGLPHQAPPEVQDEAARKLQARSGWGQWPACARRIGVSR